MKKFFLSVFTLSTLMFTSCSDDDNGGSTTNEGLSGQITEDTQLDPSIEYNLTGVLSVESGATLTIPAGTNIVTGTGTGVYIAVQKGGDIVIAGSSSNPVTMGPNSNGTWGGLVICGDGVTSEGPNSVAEVGGLVYGGDDNNDSSGSIEYLIMRQTGAQINAESQYNGLSLYAVGRNTTINNIAIIDGDDDGIEFFGGAAEASNVYVENLGDDAIDWTEGWSGKLTNAFVKHTTSEFSTAIEADGPNNNPMITNFTAVSTEGGLALQFKKESGATFSGLTITGYDTLLDTPNDAPLSGIIVGGEAISETGSYSTSTTVEADFSWVNN